MRGHELGPDRVSHRLTNNAVNGTQGISIQLPSGDMLDRDQLLGVACTPERHADARLVQRPAHGQIDSRSSVPPHIQPPMAQVPRPTREAWRVVPESVTKSMNSFLH